jgi:RNA polymerase sigma-70 factor (ECF subfamily)
LLLRVVEQFSYQEIAGILEIPVGTVMTHLARGRAKLRKDLLDYARGKGIVRVLPKLIPRPEEHRESAGEGGA